MTQVFVEQVEAGFVIRTGRGNLVGHRMISVDPEPGKEFPDVAAAQGVFETKNDAAKVAFEWNMYLMWVQTKKRKTYKRGVE